MLAKRLAGIAALIIGGAGLLAIAPPAVAASSTVDVSCANPTLDNFTVSQGDQITFILDSDCQSFLTNLLGAPVVTQDLQDALPQFVSLTGTDGSAIALVNGSTWTVTYTAGPRVGVDSLVFDNRYVSSFGLKSSYRTLTVNVAYYMTVPSIHPAPWFQSVGRDVGAPCLAGWSQSWAEWPNNRTGGFVCVRTQVWDTSSAVWSYRHRSPKN